MSAFLHTLECHRESDENYRSIVLQKGKYRVIVCKDNIQWILQQRDEKNVAGVRWRAFSYHCDRDALIRVSRAYFGSPAPMELIELPEFFVRGMK